MPHLRALTEHIKQEVKEKYALKALGVDGESDNSWVIVDFGNVMVHLFTEETRDRYDLENLWADAEKIKKFSTCSND